MSNPEDASVDLKFSPIRVITLRGDKKIPFNAYVKVGSRHVLYCRTGDSFEGERLERLKTKKIPRLYILERDESKYQDYIRKNIDEAYDLSSQKDLMTRIEIIQGHLQAIAEDIMETPEEVVYYNIGMESCIRFIEFIKKNMATLKILFNMKNEERSIGQHGVNVSGLAIAIAHQMGLAASDPEKTQRLALGCLIHDYGHQFNDIDVGKPRDQMPKEDLSIYLSHPSEGIKTIRNINHFHSSIVNIILEHHEYIDGSGFPQAYSERQIDPLTLIASTANSYDRYVSFEGLEPTKALKTMLIHCMGLHPLDAMKSMQTALKISGTVD